jgi:sodium transport system permease protein
MTDSRDRVATLFLMELRTLLRDRRTVVLSLVLPLIVTPLMLFASRAMEQRRQRALDVRASTGAVTGARAGEARALLEQARVIATRANGDVLAPLRLEVREIEDPSKALGDGTLDFYVIGRDYAEADADRRRRSGADASASGEARTRGVLAREERDGPAPQGRADARRGNGAGRQGLDTGDPLATPPSDLLTVSVVFRADRDTSRRAAERVLERLRAVRRDQRDAMLASTGFPVQPAAVAPVEAVDLAGEGQVAGLTLGRLVTLLLLFFLLSGGAIVAQDTLAGEKERGTLETLLTSAISRREIVTAKVLLVLAVALTITVIQVLNLLVYVGFGVIPTSQNLAAAITLPVAVALLVFLLPLAVLVAGVLVLVSGYARSHREAQLYFLPLMLGAAVPALAAFLPEVSLRSAIAVVPIANTSVGVKDMLVGRFDWPMLAVAWTINAAVAAWVLGLTARLLSTERLIVPAASDTRADAGSARVRLGQVGTWFAVLWAVMLVFSLNAGPDFDLRGQLIVNLIVLMLGGSLLFVRRHRLDPVETFSLRLPHWSAWIAVLVGAPAGLVTGLGIFRLSQAIVPVPPEMVKSLGQYLMPEHLPLWQVLPMLTLLPGICEELTFRGVLLSSLRRHYTPLRAAILSGLVFGLFHFAIFRIIPTAYLGVMLAGATLLSGSIYPAMVWHALNNALALTAGRAGWDLDTISTPAIAGAAVMLVLAFVVLSRGRRPLPRSGPGA